MAKRGESREPDATVPLGPRNESSPSLTVRDAAPPSAAPPLARGTTIGRYILEAPLGKGGMGVVYAAHDPELGRTVALKLLRLDSGLGSEARGWLVREAHAMAKLNHPNVVAIYDAGVHDDQVFLAVELVDGSTLREWLRGRSRGWRAILDVFLQAGRGLVAAHAAGLVHYDFKPDNVLIARTGEVKVADFGLAHAAGGPARDRAPAQARSTRAVDVGSDPVLASPIGIVVGTPAFMAPEQHLGRGGDARTDEFSFCVALYLSLYGELPFERRPDPLSASSIRPAPRNTRVPAWIRRVLARGLSIKPDDRYSTLTELLDALADDPALRRRRLLGMAAIAAAIAIAIVTTAMVIVRQRAAADPCHDPDGKLADIWDDGVRARVRAAFAASGAPDAIGTATYAEKAMDRVSGAWVAAYHDACAATRERHAQPESALNLRLDCLDDQRLGLRAAADIIAHPDANNLSAAIGAASTLPLPLECADARALSVIAQPSPEHRAQVENLRTRLARGRALGGAARYRDAIAVLDGLAEAAAAVDATALQANALVALASAHGELYEYDQAIASFTHAEQVATAAHLDPLATQAAAAVVVYKNMLGSPPVEVAEWMARARDDLRRSGLGTTAEFYVERASGYAGTTEPGDAHTRHVLDLAEKLFATGRSERLHAANEHGVSLVQLGRQDQGVIVLRKAIADTDAIFGPHNQRALLPAVNLAETLCDLGRADEAEPIVDSVFARMGAEQTIHGSVAFAVRAVMKARRGQLDDSITDVQRALDLAARLHMLANPNWAPDVHRHTIEAYLLTGRAKLALDEYEHYLTGDATPDRASSLRLGGWAYLDAGQPDKAQPLLVEALALGMARPLYPGWVPRLRYQLARALVQTKGDRLRARDLARAAHDELATLPDNKQLLGEVDAWAVATFSR